MIRAIRWLSDRPFAAATGVMLAFATIGFVRVEGIANQQEALIECVQAWGDATVARTTLLSDLASVRSDALDRLVRTVAEQDEAKFAEALADYLVKSDEYRDALAQHPVPVAPGLRCD
jgi:hypothetical protein